MNLSKVINYIKSLTHRKNELDRYLELTKKTNDYYYKNSEAIYRQCKILDKSIELDYCDYGVRVRGPVVFLAKGSSLEN